jgi:F-type H+-transporting ATPase subunit epsilon
MKPFHIDIVTPDGLAYSGQVESLLVKTDDGDTEILCGHADYMASVGTGRARLIIDGKARYASVNGGFLSVNGGDVNLVTITFEFADQIDLKRAEKAKEKAEDALKSAKSDKELDLAKAKLLRAMSRINVAGYK